MLTEADLALLGDLPTKPDPTPGLPATVAADLFADLVGVTPDTVRALGRRGVIPKEGAGRFVLRDGLRAYCGQLRRVGRPAPGTDDRARLMKANADLAEAKAAAARGELVPAVEVEREWAAILRDVRAAMLALPSRLQQRLGNLSTVDVAAIDSEIRDALAEAVHAD